METESSSTDDVLEKVDKYNQEKKINAINVFPEGEH